MIELSRFAISNYRSCVSTSLDLQQKLVCLIGINGAGKTNLLSGLLLLKRIKTGYRHIGIDADSADFVTDIAATFKVNEKEVKLKCTVRYLTDERNIDEVVQATLSFNMNSITGKSKWIKIHAAFLDYLESAPSGLRRQFDSMMTPSEKAVIIAIRNFIRRMSYYSASQFSDPTKCPISFELEGAKSFKGLRNNTTHEKFLNDLYLTHKQNPTLYARFLNTVNKEGIGLVDDIAFLEHDIPSSSYEVRSGGQVKKIEKSRQLIIPCITIDSIQLSPNQLSEGTFKTLALAFYIITDHNDMLLIEEPEVCVHHGLLESIVTLIKFQSKTKQIIISTHSDFVLDKLSPENVVLISRISKKGTIAKSLTKSLSKNDYHALKSYLLEAGNLGEYWKEGGFDNE